MPAIHWHEDDCQTADDVRRRARQTAERRQNTFARNPQVVYVERKPEVIIRTPTIQEMFAQIAASVGITTTQLAYAIRLFKEDSVERKPTPIRIYDIQKSVSARANIHREELTGQQRSSHLIRPRHIAIALCKRLTRKSLPEIGRAFDNRDHTTILHAVRKLEKLTTYVSDHIRPDAPISEWTSMMFEQYANFIKR